jgi:hypothetical protein
VANVPKRAKEIDFGQENSYEVMAPAAAVAALAGEGFQFTVEGPATYERVASLRDTSAPAV